MNSFRLLIVGASLLPAPLSAQGVPARPLPSEIRLTPDQISAVLDAQARKRELAAPAGTKLPLPIHGEVGFEVGTGGYRSFFGTIGTQLSPGGFATFSFDNGRRIPRYSRQH